MNDLRMNDVMVGEGVAVGEGVRESKTLLRLFAAWSLVV